MTSFRDNAGEPTPHRGPPPVYRSAGPHQLSYEASRLIERAYFEGTLYATLLVVGLAAVMSGGRSRSAVAGVAYSLVRGGGRGWRMQDVRVEGISLLDNSRDQFAAIIARSSYEALVERLRTRAREHRSGASASRPTARQGASGS